MPPSSVRVPEPVFTSAPPVPPRLPLNVVLVLSPPAVRIFEPRVMEDPLAPAMEPIASPEAVMALISKLVPLAARLMASLSARAPEPLMAMPPAEMVMPPVWVLFAVSVRVPAPVLLRAPREESTPERVVLLELVSKTVVPEERAILLARLRPAAPLRRVVVLPAPGLRVTAPVELPRAVLLPTRTAPPVIEVPPA